VRFFAEWFPDTALRPIYIANDFGAISAPSCGYLPLNQYHPKSTVTVDIEHVDADGVGEVVVSGRITEHTPVVEYRNGDVARFVAASCPCGSEKTFEVLGRKGYDYIKLGRALLRQEEFDRVAELCKELFDEYRLEASTIEDETGTSVGNIVLYVYKAHGGGTEAAAAEVAARVSDEVFVSLTKTLADFVKLGLCLPLKVRWVTEQFPKGIKNVKLKQVSH
jgi:hypothetical protein